MNKKEKWIKTVHESAATNPEKEVLKNLHTTCLGLDAEMISRNRAIYGSNKVTHEKKKSLGKRLTGAFINPFTAILSVLALVSIITDMVFPSFKLFGSTPEDFDALTVAIILTMVLISGTLRFVQESRSGDAAEKLLAMITTTCTVIRKEGNRLEVPMDDLVVGDILRLSAGDMVPADVRILEAKDFFVSQASLTGESEPVEKISYVNPKEESVTDYTNLAFMGSNVISGSASAVVICVGDPYSLWLYGFFCCTGGCGNQFHQRGKCRILGFDPVYDDYGPFGISGQWNHERGLAKSLFIRNFYCGGAYSGNVADDCDYLSCQRRCFHEQEADDCKKSQFHSKFRSYGYSLYR